MMISADCIVTGEEVLRPGWVEVAGHRVAGLGAGLPPRAADTALGGVTVVPGFVDTHVHGGGGGSFSDATRESTHVAVDLHRRHGTTSVVASLVAAAPQALLEQVEKLAGHVEEGLISGVHLEGPWLSPHRCGAHDPSALRDLDPAELAELLAAGRGTIRMITLAPELDGAPAAIRQIVNAGVVAAVGHTEATYDQTRAAVEAGATVATHLFNAMRPVHHREPGPVIALLEDDRVTVELITDGVHLHPALYRAVIDRTGNNRISLVTDAMAASGMPDGAYQLGGLAVQVVEGLARLEGSDTIAGGTATMDALFRFATSQAGPDLDTALLAAVRHTSIVPARTLRLTQAGLSVGATANAVVLDDEFAVTDVLFRGAWVSDSNRARR